MSRIFIAIVLGVILLSSTSYATFPLEDGGEEDIIYGPDDSVYNKAREAYEDYGSYCLSGEHHSKVVAMVDGTVTDVKYVFKPNHYTIYGYNDYEEALESFEKHGIDMKYLTMMVELGLGNRESLYYYGFKVDSLVVEVGDVLSKGAVIGDVGYGMKSVDAPCIILEYDIKGKQGDIDSLFEDEMNNVALIGEESVAPNSSEVEAEKINYRHEILSSEACLDIYNIFKDSLVEGHPGLYDYVDEETLQKAFLELEMSLEEGKTRNELFFLLNDVVKLICDNHTFIIKTYLTDESLGYEIPYDLPAKLGIVNNRCYVFEVYDETLELEVGDEIIAINGESISSIEQYLLSGSGTEDGYIKGFSFEYLYRESPNFGSGFKYLYDMAYMPDAGDAFNLTTKDKTIDYKLKELSIESKETKEFSYMSIDENTGCMILDINTMYLDDQQLDRIREALSTTECENIILDLQSNGGGPQEVTEALFAMFYDDTFTVDKRYEVNAIENMSLSKYSINLIDNGEMGTDFQAYQYDDMTGNYYLNKDIAPESFRTVEGEGLIDDKELYVLTSEMTGSAAVALTNLIDYHGLGTIIGREGAGCVHQMNALKFAKIRLGDSDLVLNMPLVKVIPNYVNTDVPFGRGVIPDIIIPNDVEALISNENHILSESIEYILAKHQSPQTIEENTASTISVTEPNDNAIVLIVPVFMLAVVLFVLVGIRIKK